MIFLTAIFKDICNFTSFFPIKPPEFLVLTLLHYLKSFLARVESVLEYIVLKSIKSKVTPYKKLAFYLKISVIILTLLCNKYFHKARIICERNVQTV